MGLHHVDDILCEFLIFIGFWPPYVLPNGPIDVKESLHGLYGRTDAKATVMKPVSTKICSRWKEGTTFMMDRLGSLS